MFKAVASNSSYSKSNDSSLFHEDSHSGFVQPKLNIGKSGDKYEQEADKAADQIIARRNQPAPFFPATSSVQKQTEEDIQQQPVVDFISSGIQLKENPVLQKVEDGKVENDIPMVAEEDSLQAKKDSDSKISPPIINIQPMFAEDLQIKEDEELQEKEEDEIQTLQNQSSGDDGANTSAIESTLSNSKGGGSPLETNTRSEMESGFGTDFSNVRVHKDSNAVQMNQQLGSQAFANGSDVYFNEGKYNPGSDSGKHLLAHELTHTVQQGASVQPKMIQKTGEEETQTENPDDILKKFYLPAVKARHLSHYQAWANQGKLKRMQGYNRGKPNQIRKWKNYFWDKMQNTEQLGLHEDFRGLKEIKIPGEDNPLRGRRRTLLKKLTITKWDRQGVPQDNTLEVDHIVELQAGGWPGPDLSANEVDNMELLDKTSNTSAGGKTRANIEKIVRNYLDARDNLSENPSTQSDAASYMASHTINFTEVEVGQGDFAGSTPDSKFWTASEIEQGLHLVYAEDLGNIGEPGSPTEFALMTLDDGFLMHLFPHGEGLLNISVGEEDVGKNAIPGLAISNVTLTSGYESSESDAVIGSITVSWNLPEKFNAPEGTFPIPIKKSESQYAGKIQNLPSFGLDFQHMSPIEFSGDYGIDEEGVFAEGSLTPSMEFLRGTQIVVGVRGEEVYFNAEFSPSNLNLPVPGLTIDSSTLWVGYSSVNGFGVGGNIEFTLSKIGAGTIEGGFTQEEGLYIRGDIQFDEELFGRTQASARMTYENEQWSIGGTLIIPEDTVRGIKTATIIADYSQQTGFTATGDAELDIPGIQRGTMTVNYGDEGFSISGNFDLSDDIPGIQGGNVEARVSKAEGAENYDVFVSGTAIPDIPGISTSLTVTYDNGALTIVGSAAYNRGMLSGTVDVGATNRTIGEDGEPTGEPDDTMRVYGGGTLTLQLTPWLAATAGVKLLPNGEIEVTARLATDTYDVFARRQFDRNLFTVPTIEIPLFAIPLGPRSLGLVAQIGGGLDFTVGFGPGQLRNLSAEITYNPEREDETRVIGHGEFGIPADAGLTLRGDLGLGLSVGIASLSGGIEIAGSLGLEGEALASVDVNWSPQTGIILDAEGRVTVNPKFIFDINAFARASLGIGFLSISETWRYNLASFSWGPDIQFGLVFPVHYQEDQAFDISFDDLEVIYPELDVVDMAVDLARDIKDDIF